ncbi:DUF4097 family beta strand repeat-containing protein [soil metagenome]
MNVRTRLTAAVCLPLVLAALSACDIVTADFKSQESAEWRKSYELQAGGTIEVHNVNGAITVEPAAGNTVEVVAMKRARGASPEAAREALEHIEIVESVSPSAIRLETRYPRNSPLFQGGGGGEVRYTLKVPTSAQARFKTVNGGIEVTDLAGSLNVQTTNGGITARGIGGPIDASTTNGGVDVELTRVAGEGVKLECTNGGIRLRLPSDARATISASVTNGGIETGGLALEASETSRRRLEGSLNGGGPNIRLRGTNGGIRLSSR